MPSAATEKPQPHSIPATGQATTQQSIYLSCGFPQTRLRLHCCLFFPECCRRGSSSHTDPAKGDYLGSGRYTQYLPSSSTSGESAPRSRLQRSRRRHPQQGGSSADVTGYAVNAAGNGCEEPAHQRRRCQSNIIQPNPCHRAATTAAAVSRALKLLKPHLGTWSKGNLTRYFWLAFTYSVAAVYCLEFRVEDLGEPGSVYPPAYNVRNSLY